LNREMTGYQRDPAVVDEFLEVCPVQDVLLFAERHEVAAADDSAVDVLAIEVAAVATAQVGQDQLSVQPSEFRMVTRGRRVRDDDVAVGCAADAESFVDLVQGGRYPMPRSLS